MLVRLGLAHAAELVQGIVPVAAVEVDETLPVRRRPVRDPGIADPGSESRRAGRHLVGLVQAACLHEQLHQPPARVDRDSRPEPAVGLCPDLLEPLDRSVLPGKPHGGGERGFLPEASRGSRALLAGGQCGRRVPLMDRRNGLDVEGPDVRRQLGCVERLRAASIGRERSCCLRRLPGQRSAGRASS